MPGHLSFIELSAPSFCAQTSADAIAAVNFQWIVVWASMDVAYDAE